jgi:hypothetical protein
MDSKKIRLGEVLSRTKFGGGSNKIAMNRSEAERAAAVPYSV